MASLNCHRHNCHCFIVIVIIVIFFISIVIVIIVIFALVNWEIKGDEDHSSLFSVIIVIDIVTGVVIMHRFEARENIKN